MVFASGAVLVLFADDSTGLDPQVCKPVVIAAANAEVHTSDAPWACIAVVPLKLAGAILAAVDALGHAPEALTEILLTHFHRDHTVRREQAKAAGRAGGG